MPKPTRVLPGNVTVAPDPVALGQPAHCSGSNIADDGSHSVWLRWRGVDTLMAGTSYNGAALNADGTFTAQSHGGFGEAGHYALDVFAGYGGPKAAWLATDTFTVA